MIDPAPGWNKTYEWRAVALLSAGFGLVGLDRWIIAPLFPAMMDDLHLTYQDLGNLVGVLAVSWGVLSTLMGGLSDRWGRRKILLMSLVTFSLLSAFSGVASGMMGLLLIRGIMGATEGSYLPTSVAAAGEASHPRRKGLNHGLLFSAFPLLGLGFGPLIATQLLAIVPSWRWVFVVVAIPGLIVAFLMYLVLKDPAHFAAKKTGADVVPWSQVLRSRNVIVSMVALLCAMSGVFVLGGMMPSYLMDYVHLTQLQMGFVTSAIGFGGFFGEFCVCGLSDLYGRRPVAVGSFLAAALLISLFGYVGPQPAILFCLLFALCFFNFGLMGLLTGPIASEAVPVGLTSSAIGLVSGAGEIFGGGIAPSGAGFVAVHYGIQYVLTVALVGLSAGLVASLFLIETAPRRVRAAVVALRPEASVGAR